MMTDGKRECLKIKTGTLCKTNVKKELRKDNRT